MLNSATTARRRVLMLAYFFPPIAVTGAVRPAAFCSHLRDTGYEPRVLSTTTGQVHPPVGDDESLLRLLPADLDVRRLPYVDRRQWVLRLMSRWRAPAEPDVSAATGGASTPGGRAAKGGRSGCVGRLRRRLVQRAFMFPDQQKDWGRAVVRHVRAMPRSERVDVVFATGSPWSALLAGLEVARHLDVPFVADFRDPWAENLKASLEEDFRDLAARLERRIVERATRVVANTDALRDYFVSLDPVFERKVIALNNGINRLALESLDAHAGGVQRTARVELNYFGSISRARMPIALLTAIDELHAEGRLSRGDLRVNFTGSWARIDEALAARMARLEELGFVLRADPVPYEECLRRMKRSDHLLILQQGYHMQIPAKIYEYMATRRPIVVLGGEGATQALVEQRECGVVCRDEIGDIRRLLERLVSGDLSLQGASEQTLRDFDYRSLTRRLADVLDAAIDEHA